LAPLVALLASKFPADGADARRRPSVAWWPSWASPGATVLLIFNAFISDTNAHGSASIETFSWGRPAQPHHMRSMLDTQTPLALVGVFAIFVPLRRLWRSADRGVFRNWLVRRRGMAVYFVRDSAGQWYLRHDPDLAIHHRWPRRRLRR
jgi:hypothetical protein